MYYGLIGFVVTFLVGVALSYILDFFNVGGGKKLFINNDNIERDSDLFVPPLGAYLRRKHEKKNKKLEIKSISTGEK